ncbi:MAG: 50S ribosomal protein L6 [Verrucomicrobia bacterium]|nr:50S ribosomal protein L6 [Verrucomicrobiota bacterium]MBV9273420.1 50S ribosomal protein L6 [Verrucomicrobiota bacterium]
MSRIGNKSVRLPEKVKVGCTEGGAVTVEGPKGKLEWTLPRQIKLRVEENEVSLAREDESRSVKALHGLSRSLINNMVTGVSQGFQKSLEIQGVGFRAQVQGSKLNLSLGFSHPVVFQIPDGIKVTVQENTKILVEGIDRQKVGQVAADIRAYYPPEPYKGKGIRYSDEQVLRKEGKTVQ